MTQLFVYTVVAFGFAYVIGHSIATRGVREWLSSGYTGEELAAKYPNIAWFLALIECPACLGWWCGLAAGAFAPMFGFVSLPIAASAIVFAFYTAGSNYLLARLTGLMEA